MNIIEKQIVVAVSSRALFNIEKEHEIFEKNGIEAYRSYQIEHRDDPLEPGVAFPFVKRLLRLNRRFPQAEPFRVVVLSRNSPETGQRFFASCRHYDLDIKAGAFTSGNPTFPLIPAYGASLFLSADIESVRMAINGGQPAGLVINRGQAGDGEKDDGELRIAFDFDGVIIDDEAEREFQKDGLQGFQEHEARNRFLPHSPGPLGGLFRKLADFQKMDAERGKDDPYFKPAIRISIVTARGTDTVQRLITTLSSVGMNAAELFLMDGIHKNSVLEVIRPHIFFDDNLKYLDSAPAAVPSVLIPFGINNQEPGEDAV